MAILYDPSRAFIFKFNGVEIVLSGYLKEMLILGDKPYRLGYFAVNSILKEYDKIHGTDYSDRVWFSEERRDWRRVDDEIILFDRFRFKFDEFAEIIIKNFICPYSNKIKKCENCIFNVDGYCRYAHKSLKLLREMIGRGIYNYIFIDWYSDYGTASWSIWIEFKIKDKDVLNRLIRRLKRDHNYSYDRDGKLHEFTKYYSFEYVDEVEYKIYIDEDGAGRVVCDGYMEIEGRDDYITALMDRDYSRHIVVKAYAKILYYSDGMIEAKYHGRWTGAGLRAFQKLVEI